MGDCISRETAIEELYKLPCKIDEDGYRWVLSRDVAHMIDDLPAMKIIYWLNSETNIDKKPDFTNHTGNALDYPN